MSKSVRRVQAALKAAHVDVDIVQTAGDTHTAAQAAAQAGCQIDQILKSIIFRGDVSGRAVLFMTAGGSRVCPDKASTLAGERLGKADAAFIRAQTGFAIGGVAPIGHISEITSFFDQRLLEFDVIWAAAGTPRHVFRIDPRILQEISTSQAAVFTL